MKHTIQLTESLNICKRLWFFVFCSKFGGKCWCKKLSSKYNQKLLDHTKKSATDPFKEV